MKKTWGIFVTLHVLLFVIVGGISFAQIPESDPVVLSADGTGSVPLYLDSSLDEVAGFQGTIIFDPGRITVGSLTLSPQQPGSFVLRYYLKTPSEIHFVVYSPTATIRKEHPVLYCNIQADPIRYEEGFTSFLVMDTGMQARPNLQTHQEPTPYRNVPLVLPSQNAARPFWMIYE